MDRNFFNLGSKMIRVPTLVNLEKEKKKIKSFKRDIRIHGPIGSLASEKTSKQKHQQLKMNPVVMMFSK